MEAFVTLVATDSYCPGALVLAHRLRDLNTTRTIVCLVTPEVSQNACLELAKVCNVVHVNTLRSNDDANLRLLGRPELDITFTKLHVWRLTQYQKIVFLDADTLPLRNVDELFDWPAFSAAPDAGWPDCFNSGVFVAKPSEAVYSDLVQLASQRGSFDGGDQGLLNTYFSEWSTSPEHRLPFIYNTTPTAQYSYAPAHVQYRHSIAISHFIGQDKPWKWQMFADGKVFPRGNAWPGLCELVQCWWDTWKKHYGEAMPQQLCASFLDPSSGLLNTELQSRPIEPFGANLTNAWDTKRIQDDMQIYDERRQTAPLPPLHITLSTPSWLPQPVRVDPEPVSVPPENLPSYGLPDVCHANEDSLPDLHAFKNEWDQPTHERSVWVAPRPPKPQVESLLGYDYSQYKFDDSDDNEDKDGHGIQFPREDHGHYEDQDQDQDQYHQENDQPPEYSTDDHVFPWESHSSVATSRSWGTETAEEEHCENFEQTDTSPQMEEYMQAQMEKIVDDLEAAQPSELEIKQNITDHNHHHVSPENVLEYQERAVDERMGGGSLEELHWTEHVDSTANETTVDEYHHQEEETTSEWQGTLYAMDTVPSSPSLRKSPFASFISLETGDDDWSDRDMIPIPLKASSRLFGDGLPLSSNGTEDAIGGGGGGSRRNSLKRRLSVSQKSPVIPKQTYTAGYPDIQSHQQSSRLFASGQTFYGKKTPYTSAAATPVAEKAFFIQDDDIMDQNYHGDFMSRNDYTLDFSLVMEMSRETEVRREEKMDQDEDEFDWDTAGALERLRNQSTSMLFAQVADAHAHSMNTLEMRDRRAGTWDDTLSETDALVSGPVSPINDVLPDALYLSQRSVPPDLFSGHASPRTPVARNMAHNLTHEINLAKERYKAEQRASLSLVKPTMAAATLLEAELDLSKSRLYKRRSKPEFDLDLEPSISPVWHAKSHDGEDIEEHHAEDTFVAYFDEDTIKEAQKKLLDLTTDKPSNPINNQESDTGPSVVFNQSTRPVTESIASFVEPETKPFELVSDQSTTTIKAWELPYSEVWDSSMASKQSALFEERMAALKQPLKQTTTTTSTVFTSFGKPTKFVDSQDAQWKSDGSWVIEDMPGHSTVLVEEKQTVVDTTPSPRATNELHSAMEDVLQTTETIFTLDSQTQPQSLEDIPSNVSNRSIETTSAFSSQTFVKVPEQSPMELLEGDLPIIETIITRSTTSLLSKDNDVSIKQADSLKQNLESLAKHLDSSKHVSQSTRVVGETDFTTTKETIVQDEQEEDMVLNAAPAQPIEVVWRQITVENSDGEEVELEEVEVDILEQDDIHEMRNEITEILLDEEESTENSSTLVRNLYVDISEDYDSDGSQEDTGDYSVEIEEDSDSYYDDEFLVAIEQDVSELVVLDEVPIEIVEGVWEALTENSIEEEASVTVQTDARTQEAPDAPKPEQDLATITLTTERSVSSIPITIVHESEPVDDSLAESKCLSSSEENDGNPKLEQSVIGSVEKLDILETVTLVTDEVPTVIVSTPEPAKSTTVTRTIVVSDERVPCELETDKSNVRTTITKTVFVDTFGDMETQEIVLEESLPIDISTETYTTQTITLVEEEPETHTDHVAKDSTSTTCKTIHVSNLDSSPSESHIDQSALESKAEVEPKTVEPKNTKDSKDTFGETVHVTHSETKSPRTDKTDYSVSKSRSMYTKAWIVEPYQTEREHEDVSEDSLFSSRVIVSETTNEDEDEEEEEEDGQNIGRRTSIRSARAVMDLLPPMESTLSRESVMSYDSMNSVVTAMLETQYTGQDSGSDYSSTRIINVPPTEISSQPEVVVENEEDMAMQAAVDRSSRLHSRVSTSEDYESERVQTITSSSSGQSLGLPRVRQKSNSTRDGDGSEHSSYFEGSAVYLSANEYEPTDMMSVSSGVDSIDWHSATGSMDFVEVVAQDDDEDEAETDARVAQWVMEELEAPSIHRLERSTSRDHLLYRYFQRQQLGGQTGGHTESTEFESVEVDVISQDSEDEGSVGSDKTAT